MSKVYKVNDGKTAADQIPSVEYINELKKMIEDALNNPDIVRYFPSIKTNIVELPIGVKEFPEVKAKEIKTDSQHRFINETILSTMIDKPSKFEVEQSITEANLDLKAYMDATYMRIVNTPNVINKLRDISTILNEDEVAAGLLNTLAEKINLQDFNEHAKSSIHMNNNDRKALNILIKCLSVGFDWNAEDGEFNAIKNKPESLPANGGNADTVANHSIKDLINRDDYDIVVGSSAEKYYKESCDICTDEHLIIKEAEFDKIVRSKKRISMIHFKTGYYVFDDYLNIDYGNHRIFTGADNRLSWIHNGSTIINDATFKNIAFDSGKIAIKSNCEFKNVRFNDCEIVFNNSENCNIEGCIFNNCTFKVDGTVNTTFIIHNRFIRTKPFQYIGGNNIIKDNIY